MFQGAKMEMITKAEAARLLEVSRTWVVKLAKKGELRQNEKGLIFRIDVEKLRQNRIAGTIQEQLREVRNQLETMIEEKNKLQDKNNALTIANILAEKEKELLAKDLEMAVIKLDSERLKGESTTREKESIEDSLNRLLEAQANQIHSLQEDKRNQAAKLTS